VAGVSIAVINLICVLAALGIVWRIFRDVLHARYWVFGVALLAGAFVGAACLFIEVVFFGWIGVFADVVPDFVVNPSDFDVATAGFGGALVAMLLFAAPLEEGGKLLAVWPLHTRGQLVTRADSVYSALCVAGGFALCEGTFDALYLNRGLVLGRVLLASVGHLFFAGVWAFVLGDSLKRRRLRLTWSLATLFHGLFAHIVLVRGEGALAVLVPVVGSMLVLSAWGVRSVGALPRALQWVLPAQTSIDHAFVRPAEGIKWRWLAAGALVTTGVAIMALVIAVIIGHRIGIDFAAADEGDVRANGPLVLLGASITSAFPVAGYLVAKASGTRSLLEPAFGAALSVAGFVAALTLAAPVTVVFTLPMVPVAIALTCVGAWFGLSR
jgi:hypothetical protein